MNDECSEASAIQTKKRKRSKKCEKEEQEPTKCTLNTKKSKTSQQGRGLFLENFKIHYNKRFKCFTHFSVDVCFVKFIWFVCSTEYTGSELGADCSEVSLTDPGAEDDQGYIQFLPKSDFSFGSALIGHFYQLHHYVSGRSSIQREQLRRRFHKAPPNIQKGPIWQKEKPKKNLSQKQQ